MVDHSMVKLLLDSMRREIILHDHLYYGMDKSVITDKTYDYLMKDLEKMEEMYEYLVAIPKDSPTQVPGHDRFK